MTTQELFDLLNNHSTFNKIVTILDETNNEVYFGECIRLRFNDHLTLYIASNPPPYRPECTVEINNLTHYHIDDDELIEDLEDIVNDCVFIETPYKRSIAILAKEKFEKHREKYLKMKHVKIYTANELIFYSI